ncbi:MAG TPA: 50S ribosomal protein L6 [Burkholderiales bacterium]
MQVTVDGHAVTVKGPLGTLTHAVTPHVTVKVDGSNVTFVAANESKEANALSGTLRANVANMVQGVKEGFQKKLNLVGVGYRAQAQGNKLNLTLGFSHPIVHALPEGVKAETPTQTEILIKGVDRQRVGQVAAEVRAYKPPEPYKGKGVRYADEKVVIKETKKK